MATNKTSNAGAGKTAKATKRKQSGKNKRGGSEPLTKADFKRENRRQIGTVAKYVLVAIGVLAMLLSVTSVACSGFLNQASSDDDYTLTGGVAATVNGTQITEDTVTEQIMSTRSSYGYDDDEDWAEYLASNDMTPESYRESVIDSLIDSVLVSQAERDADITVSDDEVEEEWQEIVSSYDSEDAFIEVLEQIGYTEDSYKEMIRENLVSEKFEETVAPAEEPTDEEIVEYANENLDTYNNARRSSQILISVDSDADDDTREEALQEAQDILDQINAGEISFEDAAEEYSDDSSADDGGDVGWDVLNSFVDEYQEALDGLSVGEVSDVVESDYGYHIIMCTDIFSVDGSVTSIDEIPEDLQSTFSETIQSNNQSEAYTEWLENYRDEADIEIFDMPEDVPYNVDMSSVSTDSDDTDDATADTDDTTDDTGDATADSDDATTDESDAAGDSSTE